MKGKKGWLGLFLGTGFWEWLVHFRKCSPCRLFHFFRLPPYFFLTTPVLISHAPHGFIVSVLVISAPFFIVVSSVTSLPGCVSAFNLFSSHFSSELRYVSGPTSLPHASPCTPFFILGWCFPISCSMLRFPLADVDIFVYFYLFRSQTWSRKYVHSFFSFFFRWGYALVGNLETWGGASEYRSPHRNLGFRKPWVNKGTDSSALKVFWVLSRGSPPASKPPPPTYLQADNSLIAVIFWKNISKVRVISVPFHIAMDSASLGITTGWHSQSPV